MPALDAVVPALPPALVMPPEAFARPAVVTLPPLVPPALVTPPAPPLEPLLPPRAVAPALLTLPAEPPCSEPAEPEFGGAALEHATPPVARDRATTARSQSFIDGAFEGDVQA